jgi:cobalt-zinc-cadmium efflux system outer membrane protein
MRLRLWWWPALLLGCQTYQAEPLDPEKILAEIAARREERADQPALTLEDAARWMLETNPRILEARAAYATAQGFADVPTPRKNPKLDLFPIFTDVPALGSDRLGVDATLGWAIMLGNKRKLTDDLNAIRADEARISVAATEREEYLALRREYLGLAMSDRIQRSTGELRDGAEASLRTMRRLVDAGQGTALDVRDFEWQFQETAALVAGAEETRIDARAKLAARTGVPARGFGIPGFPDLPEATPTQQELRERLLRDHPMLARRRAEYAVAEKELRLEIAHQYPDLDFFGLYAREEGDNKYGLGLGIEIPLFDRNQPGIARARLQREEVRDRFESKIRSALIDIDTALDRLGARRKRLRLLTEQVQPIARETKQLLMRALESGTAGALRFLTVLRRAQELDIDILEAEWAVLEAWMDLEAACGSPFVVFPDAPVAKEQS